jgi:hypothetical protein
MVVKRLIPLSFGYFRSVLENRKSHVSTLGISILGKEEFVGILNEEGVDYNFTTRKTEGGHRTSLWCNI